MADHTPFLLGWLIFGAICGAIAALIGKEKGMPVAGFFYGLLLGPLGILFVAIAKDDRIQCPVCRELIHPSAAVCPKCLSSMLNLRLGAAPREQPRMNPEVVEQGPPKVIPKPPRIVARATQAVAKVTQALGKVPVFFIRKPLKVIRSAPPGVTPEPPKEIPKARRIVTPGPPKEIPKSPRAVEKPPRFFIYKSADEVLGPFDLAQIQALMDSGVITGQTQFCREGESEWKQSPGV